MRLTTLAPIPGKNQYECMAETYYHQSHTTTRAFEFATSNALAENNIDGILPGHCLALDVGSGRGMLPEYLPEFAARAKRIELDLSRAMLAIPRGDPIAGLVQADATHLPFRDSLCQVVTAFLFDPFNKRDFLLEARRVCRRDGVFLGSLPSWEFASAARRLLGIPPDKTVFKYKGSTLIQDSYLSKPDELRSALMEVGFSRVLLFSGTLGKHAPDSLISTQIVNSARERKVHPRQLPLVYVVVAQS